MQPSPTPSSRPPAFRVAGLLAIGLALLLSLPGCQPAGQSMDRAPAGFGADTSTSPPRAGGQDSAGRDGVGQVVRARILRVQDGDSFIVTTSGGRRTVRINGIDAPERYQPHADQSRKHLLSLLANREIDLYVRGTDQYGRLIAQVFTVTNGGSPADIGLAQLQAGLAWFFRRYQRDLPPALRDRYAEAENSARKAGIGLWQATDPEPPWEYRRRKRTVSRDPLR